jgi:CheY-like chemotaxis protein
VPLAARDLAQRAVKSEQDVVLVIDDSEIARASMMAVLADAGMKVVELASPIGATRAILHNNVSVVVVDVLMPGMRGDRLALLFRGNPRFKKLGVVLVSGESEAELDRLVAETGADAAVSKSNLRELVGAVLRAGRRRLRNLG